METLFYTCRLHVTCVCCIVYVHIHVCLGPSSPGGADFLGGLWSFCDIHEVEEVI